MPTVTAVDNFNRQVRFAASEECAMVRETVFSAVVEAVDVRPAIAVILALTTRAVTVSVYRLPISCARTHVMEVRPGRAQSVA